MLEHNLQKIVVVEEVDVGTRLDAFLSSKITTLTRAKAQKLMATNNVFLLQNNCAKESDKKNANSEDNQNNESNSKINFNSNAKSNADFKSNSDSRSDSKKNITEQETEVASIVMTDKSFKVQLQQKFLVNIAEETSENITPQDIPLDIIFEDEEIILINKPSNLVVHPGAGNYDNTMVNALVFKYQENLSTINGNFRAGIVHRLDKDTSGILVVAKKDYSHSELAKQFEDHSITRSYRALVWGALKNNSGKIESFIARSESNRQKMAVNFNNKGKKAITNYKVLYNYNNLLSLVELTLETGRTHQIRVHMAHLGNPVVGDPLYSNNNNAYIKKLSPNLQIEILSIKRQFLHAFKLGFVHPTNKQELLFIQQEPDNLLQIYQQLGFINKDSIFYNYSNIKEIKLS